MPYLGKLIKAHGVVVNVSWVLLEKNRKDQRSSHFTWWKMQECDWREKNYIYILL